MFRSDSYISWHWFAIQLYLFFRTSVNFPTKFLRIDATYFIHYKVHTTKPILAQMASSL